jgi:membrane protein YdbS with pleckstrin-like domain
MAGSKNMNEFSRRVAQHLPQSWLGKIVWAALAIAVFWFAYLAGDYIAPTVAAVVQLMTAIVNVFIHPPRLPLP